MSRDRIQRFEVVAQLGTGGMGTVYRARDPHLQRDVAIKLLVLRGDPPPELSSVRTIDLRAPATTSEDLLAEARVMAQLSHPNVLPVFEVGLDAGEVFLVMELVEGGNLRTWLRGRPPVADVMRAFAEAARGLAAAHARGIVHRDFKPDNVLIGDDGRVRVADFGLSLLARGADPLIQWGDVAGTPEYMAPEQLHGGPATPQSDVYAFARSLAEALTGMRGEIAELEERLRAAAVAPELRALIRDGLADDPAARPVLAGFLAVLDGRRPARRRGALIGAVVVGAVAVAGYATTRVDDVAACERATVAYGAPWDAARRAELVRALGAAGPEVAALVDRRTGELAASRHAACSARADGTTTAGETAIWLSCLERRRVELGAIVRHAVLARKPDARRVGDAVFGLPDDCRGRTDPPLPADPAAALALAERLLLVPELPRSQQVTALAALEQAAAALGERELEARAAYGVGQTLRGADRLADALIAYQRSHRIATELHSTNLEVRALLEDANISAATGDVAGANRLVDIARETIDRPELIAWNRARVLLALGRVQQEKAQTAAALDSFARGRTLLEQSGRSQPSLEILLRTDLLNVLLPLRDRRVEALALARDTLRFVEQLEGKTTTYALALQQLASAQLANDQLADAIASRQESLAVYLKYLPANHSSVIHARQKVAALESRQGHYREARDQFRAAFDAAEGNEMLRAERSDFLQGLAIAEFNLGNFDDGMQLFQQEIDEAVATRGKDHPDTLRRLEQYADYALDAGRLEDATTRFAAVIAGYRARPDPSPFTLARVEGDLGVGIALARGKPRDAEVLARTSLATVQGIAGTGPKDREWIESGLARALAAQGRWQDALAAAEAALADAGTASEREDHLAVMQLTRARALYELGHRSEARDAARTARDVLARYPGQRSANQEAEALVARTAR